MSSIYDLYPPWVRNTRRIGSTRQLREWRKRAYWLARSKGAFCCCDLCKRPMGDGKRDRWSTPVVWIMAPAVYAKRATRRRLCAACLAALDLWLRERETASSGWDSPTELLRGDSSRLDTLRTYDPHQTFENKRMPEGYDGESKPRGVVARTRAVYEQGGYRGKAGRDVRGIPEGGYAPDPRAGRDDNA